MSATRQVWTERCTTSRCSMWCMSKRLSLSLEPADEAAVAAFSDRDTLEHRALLEWAKAHDLDLALVRSDASLMRVLLRAGAETLRERALNEGYAQMARDQAGDVTEVSEGRRLRQWYALRTDSAFDE